MQEKNTIPVKTFFSTGENARVLYSLYFTDFKCCTYATYKKKRYTLYRVFGGYDLISVCVWYTYIGSSNSRGKWLPAGFQNAVHLLPVTRTNLLIVLTLRYFPQLPRRPGHFFVDYNNHKSNQYEVPTARYANDLTHPPLFRILQIFKQFRRCDYNNLFNSFVETRYAHEDSGFIWMRKRQSKLDSKKMYYIR